jgi:hypothetical protein
MGGCGSSPTPNSGVFHPQSTYPAQLVGRSGTCPTAIRDVPFKYPTASVTVGSVGPGGDMPITIASGMIVCQLQGRVAGTIDTIDDFLPCAGLNGPVNLAAAHASAFANGDSTNPSQVSMTIEWIVDNGSASCTVDDDWLLQCP